MASSSTSDRALVIAVAILSAGAGAALARWLEKKWKQEQLGPPSNADTRYQLNLRGRVDRIYDYHGPKPFEFNREVVKVFDDMVSRSVPLYCEVIDLCIYWTHRYYREGTRIYDLGCSTGTTFDVLARSFDQVAGQENPIRATFVGVDNSQAMVDECNKKLAWAKEKNHSVDIHLGDVLGFPITDASIVIMTYTLQFIPVARRHDLLRSIFQGLCDGGILFISEKVRTEYTEFQETCTWIYEDFKYRRGYSKRYIARKKDALMNVLIPFTDEELKRALKSVGFEHVEVIAKWNNFTTFVARKTGFISKIGTKQPTEVTTPHMDQLFNSCPVYLSDFLDPVRIQRLCQARMEAFASKGGLGAPTLKEYDTIAESVLSIPEGCASVLKYNESVLQIGTGSDLNEGQMQVWRQVASSLKPWKKGPLNLFGIEIDTEWRSDWKWERIQKCLPSLKDKVVCDLGCGNGYFMFRMLEYGPKAVIGIDPNLHAWLEFSIFKRFSGVENVHLELLRGDAMTYFTDTFDVIFCLGVLYHTADPIGMLRDIYKSMRKGSYLIVDCQGIPGDDSIALFPKKKYANMSGVYFFPTKTTLKYWLQRANFVQHEEIYCEPLSTEEQRITEWAPVTTSLKESLDASDPSKTVEGYPAPYRFYIKAKRG